MREHRKGPQVGDKGEMGFDFLTITQGPLYSIPSFSLPCPCRPLPQGRRLGVPVTQPTQLTSPDSICWVVRCAPRLFSSKSAPLPPLLGPTPQPVMAHGRLPARLPRVISSKTVLCGEGPTSKDEWPRVSGEFPMELERQLDSQAHGFYFLKCL